MKIINYIRMKWYDIDYNIKKYSPIYIDLSIFTILTEWLKASKYYVFPYISFDYYKNISDNMIFNLSCQHLGWKWKWDYISFESCPNITLTLFNIYCFRISFNSPAVNYRGSADNNMYWESMLNYLYKYNKDIIKTYNNWSWENCITVKNNKSTYIIGMPSWNWNVIHKSKINDIYKKCNQKEFRIDEY